MTGQFEANSGHIPVWIGNGVVEKRREGPNEHSCGAVECDLEGAGQKGSLREVEATVRRVARESDTKMIFGTRKKNQLSLYSYTLIPLVFPLRNGERVKNKFIKRRGFRSKIVASDTILGKNHEIG